MRRFYNAMIGTCSVLFLWGAVEVTGTAQSVEARIDSTVVDLGNGDVVVKYSVKPFDFGTLHHPDPAQRRSVVLSEEEKNQYFDTFRASQESLSSVRKSPRRVAVQADFSDYAVGEIPMEAGVSPTGARTYQIPIVTAAGFKLTPSIALGYNSQSGFGWAGYGWDIQGISTICLISKNYYYHDMVEGASVENKEAVFSLDGVPLVKNDSPTTSSAFPLKTASGNILVAPEKNSNGYVTKFSALYPSGLTMVFGVESDNSYLLPSYPVTEIRNFDGDVIKFDYLWDMIDGNHKISSIHYGFDDAGQFKGEIEFEYYHLSSHPAPYYAGKLVSRSYRLSKIVSKNEGIDLMRYNLSYEEKDNVSLLSKIDCTSGQEKLRPLQFVYGDENSKTEGSDYLYRKADPLFLSKAFTSDDVDFYYKRGKFVADSFNDGLLIYPIFPEYDVTDHCKPPFGHNYYEFGSLYAEDQKILFAPSLSDINDVDDSIVTGPGFQTIEAVDVDGDGVDEIVKVNFDGTSSAGTLLLITVYKCSSLGTPVIDYAFKVWVNGVHSNKYFTSPARRAYYWGDFRGNGKIQLLTVAYDKNYNSKMDYDQESYAALIDISEKKNLSEKVLFTFPIDKSGCLITCDIDNDSKTELCYATDSGFDVYRVELASFVKVKTYANVTSADLSSTYNPYYITDINGDGYMDIVRAPVNGSAGFWNCFSFTGTGFRTFNLRITSRNEGDEFMFIDVNHDGLADLVKISGTTLGTCMNSGLNWFDEIQQSPSAIESTKGVIPANVVDYLGMSSFIKIDGFYAYEYSYTSISPVNRQLTKSIDSFGRTLCNTFAYLPENSLYWTDKSMSVTNTDDYLKRTLPLYVLTREAGYQSEDTPSSRFLNKYYNYYDGVIHNKGLGFCGFSRIRSFDYSGDAVEISDETHDPEKHGVVTKVEARHRSVVDSPYCVTTNTYDDHSTTYGKLNPHLVTSVTNDALTGVVTTVEYTYDGYDYPTSVQTSRRIGSGAAQTEKISRTYQHNLDLSKYILGLVQEESVVKKDEGATSLAWKERLVTTYDDLFRPLTSKKYVGKYGMVRGTLSKTISADDAHFAEQEIIVDRPGRDSLPHLPIKIYDATNLVSETCWRYDGHGNVISELTATLGADAFIGTTYVYDVDGRYLMSKTDAMGRTTTYGDFNKFGKPGVETDYRGQVKSFIYDGLGNLIKTKFPDGSEENIRVDWGGLGLYVAYRESNSEPDRVVHYDALGRELRSGVKRFDGQWQYVDKEYDTFGRVCRVSLPFRGTSATYWNTYSYDEYGRPLSISEASGRTSSWSYDGVSVTTLKDGVSSTKTMDACGNVVSVADAGGTITYSLRNDGQPSSITAPGGVVTTFGYDDYGRRIKIEDPSAGTQTDSYVWNSDGSSVLTHTNPNGTVVTYNDKYGRVTLIERPGEYNSTYVYDKYGCLSSERSTNGTGIEYVYDNLGRVTYSREFVPDGKWLEKYYDYGHQGELLSVRYVSQSGQITTESFLYANGYNTSITLHDGTIVRSLVSENDLGMTTKIMSGEISREYGFSAFGIPLYRRMDEGDLQDFIYNFDPLTGNLLSRMDGLNNVMETFDYDRLNRLISIGDRNVEYSNNGNITSIDGVGMMEYGAVSRPYQITTFYPETDDLVSTRVQNVSYTCYSRPSILAEGGRSAAFTYNGDGDRVKMYVAEGSAQLLTRYYIGGRYEYDQTPEGIKERLYLGGDAYSAPMVLQRENGGDWVAYNIGRDYLGNITHILTKDGTFVAEYSYDPWGRLRNPETLEIYPVGEEPVLFLGRGFTGHEHLTWFGLINMNARLYDPLLGRFLSPDPYVQAPDFTQNFNRYSYALNNPLKFSDDSGEFWNLVIGAIVGGVGNVISNWKSIKAHGPWSGVGHFFVGAAVGAASAAGAGWVAGVTKAAGVGAGALVGAASGAVSGAATSSLTTIGNNIISGRAWDSGLKSSALNGALWGAVSGAISGGIEGYKYAKKNNANPWTNKIKGQEMKFERAMKEGVPKQTNPEEYCYAYSSAYADKGHGNHSVNDFIKEGGYKSGGDVSGLSKLSEATLASQGDMSELTKNFGAIGGSLLNDRMEMMATVISESGKEHFVNIFKMTVSNRLQMFGGGTALSVSFSYWDPATGMAGSGSSISFFKIYKF